LWRKSEYPKKTTDLSYLHKMEIKSIIKIIIILMKIKKILTNTLSLWFNYAILNE